MSGKGVMPLSLSLLKTGTARISSASFIPSGIRSSILALTAVTLSVGILSEIASARLVPEASVNWVGIIIRLAVYFAVAVAIGSIAAQHREDVRTLEGHVAKRTSELEGVNRTLNAATAQRA